MTKLIKSILPVLVLICFVGSVFAQKSKHDDAVITIKVDGKEQDLEAYFEEWGEELGRKIERAFDNKEVHIDFDNVELKMNDLSEGIEVFAESIAKVVEDAVTNMTIELKDIDPDDVERGNFSFDDDKDLDDLIAEIERKYDAEVTNIDALKIKIRKDYVKINMDVTLDNGKKINKTKIYPH